MQPRDVALKTKYKSHALIQLRIRLDVTNFCIYYLINLFVLLMQLLGKVYLPEWFKWSGFWNSMAFNPSFIVAGSTYRVNPCDDK